jgi:hypothetical protein
MTRAAAAVAAPPAEAVKATMARAPLCQSRPPSRAFQKASSSTRTAAARHGGASYDLVARWFPGGWSGAPGAVPAASTGASGGARKAAPMAHPPTAGAPVAAPPGMLAEAERTALSWWKWAGFDESMGGAASSWTSPVTQTLTQLQESFEALGLQFFMGPLQARRLPSWPFNLEQRTARARARSAPCAVCCIDACCVIVRALKLLRAPVCTAAA